MFLLFSDCARLWDAMEEDLDVDAEEEEILRQHRLCGFVTLGLRFSSNLCAPSESEDSCVACEGDGCANCASLVGSKCTVQGQGADVYLRIESSGLFVLPLSVKANEGLEELKTKLAPIDADLAEQLQQRPEFFENDGESKRAASGGGGGGGSSSVKRKRGGTANANGGGGGGGSILPQLQWIISRNSAVVQGRILAILCKGGGGEKLLVALLDVYLPSSAWAGATFWKSGPLAAAALSHVSCDWDKRRETLKILKSSGQCENVDNVWDLSSCSVLGCKLHQVTFEAAKQQQYDLHSLFKSLPSYKTEDIPEGLKIQCDGDGQGGQTGIWDVPDEIITSILSRLLPRDLHNVGAVCRYSRLMAVSIMPCMNLRLFPHQQAAVRWMLQRESNAGVMLHPLFKRLETEDGFPFTVDLVTGELSPESPPEVYDFCGGLFCDEPGLGKTVTALSLILKTQGARADPPPNTQVYWVPGGSGERMGYYEVNATASNLGGSALKRSMYLKARRNQEGAWESCRESSSRRLSADTAFTPQIAATSVDSPSSLPVFSTYSRRQKQTTSLDESGDQATSVSISTRLSNKRKPMCSTVLTEGSHRVTRSSIRVKRRLCERFEGALNDDVHGESKRAKKKVRFAEPGCAEVSPIVAGPHSPTVSKYEKKCLDSEYDISKQVAMPGNTSKWIYEEEIWVQCEACSKWRKLPFHSSPPHNDTAWFCSLNPDSEYQNCSVPEETSDNSASVKSLPGFYKTGSLPGQPQNVAFFASVLKENAHLYDEYARRPVMWLASLNHDKLSKLATVGLAIPRDVKGDGSLAENRHYDTLLKLFGLVNKKGIKGASKWHYPKGLDSLIFDTVALREAARKPRDDATRLYLSKATLIVVPQNLVEHWKHQIRKHTTPGQLRVCVWADLKKQAAPHTLAWEYDVVITTFNRLSTEWSTRENSLLMRVHWLRIILDEGHTLGASLTLTNKLQMAISLHASRRWILTGTPTPNTPSSQAAYLQPMLKFLHEGIYGKHQKLWETAILRPFEAGCEEGRSRLTELLHRVMISSRKADLCTIPPCTRKVKLLDFTEAHAASYNELVVTVQRNILLADWRDPSHVESLLNPKQWKFRSNTLRNARLSCCVAGHIKVGDCGQDIKETMDFFTNDKGLDPSSNLYSNINNALFYGGNCDRCLEWCRLPIVTPCCHLLCMSCVALDCEKCSMPGCSNFYKMQSPAELARPENPTPKWPVPQDLIELQPSYAQDDWDPDWHATSSSKVAYLVEQLKVIQNDNQLQCPRDTGAIMEAELSGPVSNMWQITKKASTTPLPEKAIVFSQFLEHINVIEAQLKAAGIQHVGMYSPLPASNKMKALQTFQEDSECIVLVMDGTAALGLDLSFVTHVYLMEPIWDGSMEEQVVSRAHRMGATRPVLVETLAMRGTIEQQMLEYLQDPTGRDKGRLKDGHDMSGRTNHRSTHDPVESNYLARMDFVRTGTIAVTS